MDERKKIFNYNVPRWKKIWNAVDYPSRLSFVLMLGLGILFQDQIRKGLANSNSKDLRNIWIREHVRDPKATEFAHLDEEAPPVQLKPKTPLENFRDEFARIKDR